MISLKKKLKCCPKTSIPSCFSRSLTAQGQDEGEVSEAAKEQDLRRLLTVTLNLHN